MVKQTETQKLQQIYFFSEKKRDNWGEKAKRKSIIPENG